MDTDKIAKKTITAVLFTSDNLKIEGKVFVTQPIRLVDELNRTEKTFIALGDATITILESQETIQRDVVLVNKTNIACISPLE